MDKRDVEEEELSCIVFFASENFFNELLSFNMCAFASWIFSVLFFSCFARWIEICWNLCNFNYVSLLFHTLLAFHLFVLYNVLLIIISMIDI